MKKKDNPLTDDFTNEEHLKMLNNKEAEYNFDFNTVAQNPIIWRAIPMIYSYV